MIGSVICLGLMIPIGLFWYYLIHDNSSGDDLKNWGLLVVPVTTSVAILTILGGHFTGKRKIEDKNLVGILILILAMMFFVAIGVGVADSHYNKIEAEVDRLERFNIANSKAMEAKAKVERAAADAAEFARLAVLAAEEDAELSRQADSAEAAELEREAEEAREIESCNLIDIYMNESRELLTAVEDIINELSVIESIIINNGTAEGITNFEEIKSKIESEYQAILDDVSNINTISCDSECSSCISGFTNYLDESILSGVTQCNDLYTACTEDSTCSGLLSEEYGTDSTGGYENQDLNNLYSCYCENVPEGRGPCITGSTADAGNGLCDNLDQLTESARLACSRLQHEISEASGLIQDAEEVANMAAEALQWNNMTEYFEKEGQSNCLRNDDRSREENKAVMEECLKRYFVSGNYSGVSSGETDFQTVCDSDLKTDDRINFIKAGGQGDASSDKYMYQTLVRSGVDEDIDNELDKYCSGICSTEEEGVSERCYISNSRTRRSVNHFNNMMSNMKACSEEGGAVDTTGDGVNEGCSTDILTDPKMYNLLNDLIITN
jgi:hypothetical protein